MIYCGIGGCRCAFVSLHKQLHREPYDEQAGGLCIQKHLQLNEN